MQKKQLFSLINKNIDNPRDKLAKNYYDFSDSVEIYNIVTRVSAFQPHSCPFLYFL